MVRDDLSGTTRVFLGQDPRRRADDLDRTAMAATGKGKEHPLQPEMSRGS
jgi:hypothetical protein